MHIEQTGTSWRDVEYNVKMNKRELAFFKIAVLALTEKAYANGPMNDHILKGAIEKMKERFQNPQFLADWDAMLNGHGGFICFLDSTYDELTPKKWVIADDA
jgi:hypothetical protein